jgi:hypothetical protein
MIFISAAVPQAFRNYWHGKKCSGTAEMESMRIEFAHKIIRISTYMYDDQRRQLYLSISICALLWCTHCQDSSYGFPNHLDFVNSSRLPSNLRHSNMISQSSYGDLFWVAQEGFGKYLLCDPKWHELCPQFLLKHIQILSRLCKNEIFSAWELKATSQWRGLNHACWT